MGDTKTTSTKSMDEVNEPRISPKFDISSLPYSQSVYQLKETQAFYQKINRLPPFVLQKNNWETYRPVLLAPDERLDRPGSNSLDFRKPIILELVRRYYNREYEFFTLDLNGTRWIVKSESGGLKFLRGRYSNYQPSRRYHCWLGVDKQFSVDPVAYAAPKDLFRLEPLSDKIGRYCDHTGYSKRFNQDHLTAWILKKRRLIKEKKRGSFTPKGIPRDRYASLIVPEISRLQTPELKSNSGSSPKSGTKQEKMRLIGHTSGGSGAGIVAADTEESRVSPPSDTLHQI